MTRLLSRALRLTIVIVSLLAAVGAGNAWATYGDQYGLAQPSGSALPGPLAFWAGTCQLDQAPPVGDTIPGGVGSRPSNVLENLNLSKPTLGPAPAVPLDCIDPGLPDTTGTATVPWTTPPSWRLAPITQAGAHPDATTTFTFSRDSSNESGAAVFGAMPTGSTRDVQVALPPGLVGNPAAVPTCPNVDFSQVPVECPADTQVGVTTVETNFSIGITYQVLPVYNLVPLPAKTAEFGIPGVDSLASFRIDAIARTDGDFGLTTGVERIPTAAPLLSQSLTFWGVPWASSHDLFRPQAGTPELDMTPVGLDPSEQAHYQPSWGPIEPFLTNPTTCDGSSPTVTFMSDSWQNPASFLADGLPNASDTNWKTATSASPPVTGCGELAGHFSPSLSLQPTDHGAGDPSGYGVDLSVPQNNTAPGGQDFDPSDTTGAPAYFQSSAGLATTQLKDTSVTLPQGVTLNPDAADGLASCTEAQIGLTNASPITFNNDQPSCPDASKVGTVEIDTPLLSDPLTGTVYLAAQNANPFGSLVALYLVVQDPARGLIIKLAGNTSLNPQTGQITATFMNNPQLPFSDFKLSFIGGSRAPLANPQTCGTFTTHTVLTPWSAPLAPAVDSDNSFDLFANCDQASGFSPALTAGVQTADAGGSSAFTLTLSRAQGENISGINVTLPPGLLAKLAGVPLCPDARAQTGACPASSQVGHVTLAVGPGADPLSIPEPGKAATAVYLAGPYQGAPYSLVIMVPAQAGPFDLGTVTVRAAIYVDPTTAQVTVKSDPLPQILDGVPLQYRTINVTIDRPGFIQTPTSCDPMQIAADITGAPLGGPVSVNAQGAGFATAPDATANLSNRFQVGGCSSLGFTPKLKIALTGKGKTKSGDHPTLTATLTDPAGQANIQSAKVALPLSIALDPNNSQHVCATATADAVQGGAVGCPDNTIVGTANVVTPLLDQPLTGNVYLVQGVRTNKQGQQVKTLPSLLVPLRGQIALDLRAQTSVSGGKLVTTFPTIPDAAVSTFTLKIDGGKKGLLVVTGRGLNICAKKQVGNANFGAQSGKTHAGNMTLTTPCSKAAKLHVLSKKMNAGALTLRVRTSERGKVTVTGQQLTGFSKTLAGGTHTIKVQVKPASTRGSRAKRSADMKVTVTVAPANARPAAKTLSVRS